MVRNSNIRTIPADISTRLADYRSRMIEAAIDLMMTRWKLIWKRHGAVEEVLMLACARVQSRTLWFPSLTGTAFKNKGVQPLLDAVVIPMPSPVDVKAIEGVQQMARPRYPFEP